MSGHIHIPSSLSDQKKINKKLTEMANSLTRIEAEQAHIKTIANDLKEEFGLETKLTRGLAASMVKHNFEEIQTAFENYQSAYEILVEGRQVGVDA